MIAIQNMSKAFGKLQVLKSINLQLRAGECVALIGPNGCGKTTLIKSILGMVLPDEGDIHFKGKSIAADIAYRSEIGYMPQIGRYPENMTIGQVIAMIRDLRHAGCQVDEELYRAFEIERFLNKQMRTLSGGTMQKVSATLAFLFNPAVLILDEPTAGLDPLAAELLKTKISAEKKKGKLILITSHILSELDELVSQIVLMQEGSLIFHKDIEALKSETGAERPSKAILSILKENSPKGAAAAFNQQH